MLPKNLGTNSIPSDLSVYPGFLGPRQFLFLLSWVGIFLLVSFFFIDFSPSNLFQQVPKTSPVDASEIDFPSPDAKNRFIENFKQAQETTDGAKRYELLKINFTALRLFYEAKHEPKLREQAQGYANYMEANYPEEAKKDQGLYLIPCLDTACGQTNYLEEVETIKTELKSITPLEPLVLDSILKKFEAAALSSDTNFQWQNYFVAFQEIRSERERTKDEKLGAVGVKLRDFLQAKYPELFNQWERDLGEPFKI